MARAVDCPFVPPPCPMIFTPSIVRSINETPTASRVPQIGTCGRVMVRTDLAQRRELALLGEGLDEPRQRILSASEVREVVAQPAAGMREQLPEGGRGGRLLVGEAELGQVAADGGIQLDLPALD